MAISFNTGATASVTASGTASGTITIPAGVAAGDVILVLVSVFTTATGTLTNALSSTGTAPTQVGVNENANAAGVLSQGSVFQIKASGSDAGKVLTFSTSGGSGGSYWYAVALAAYTGAASATPVDVITGSGTFTSNNAGGATTPAATTGVSGDWHVSLIGYNVANGTSITKPSSLTSRETLNGNQGVMCGIADSAASVGAAGTSIGSVTWTSQVPNNTWVNAFTVGLAPAGGTAHNATGALTVTPAGADTLTHGHNPSGALTVTPSRSATRLHAAVRAPALTVTPVRAVTRVHAATIGAALTVRPSFGAATSGGRKQGGQTPDRARWWK